MPGEKFQIYLNIYDFTPQNFCLQALGLGGYHTGIQLKDLQFCYFVCDTDKTKTGVMVIEPQTAQFSFNRKIFLGETQLTGQQLDAIIEQLSQKYTCGKYHLFKNNCNHFSDDFAKKLTGNPIPKWIFNSTNILSFLCCCLPNGLVSGQWALEMLEQQIKNQSSNKQDKRKYSESTEF